MAAKRSDLLNECLKRYRALCALLDTTEYASRTQEQNLLIVDLYQSIDIRLETLTDKEYDLYFKTIREERAEEWHQRHECQG